jgi:hypothetical protein
MDKILKLNIKTAFMIFVVMDLLCVGMGMGVPFFNILFGFPVGWYIARRSTVATENLKDVMNGVYIYAVITSIVTFAIMSIIWGRTILMLFDFGADFQNFGIPLILYDPKISFIGWIVLMILVSPFLQLLSTIFASYLTLMKWLKNGKGGT